MKKIMALLLALCLVCLSVTALAEGNDVTGDWYGSMFGMAAQLTFKEDGTYAMKLGEVEQGGTYELKDDGIVYMDESEDPEEGFVFDGASLVNEKRNVTFTREQVEVEALVLAEAALEGLSAADVFQKRTPRAIAAALDSRAGRESLDERDEAARKTAHSLSQQQLQILDSQLFRPGSTMWSNTHFLVRFNPEEVEAERLCRAVNQALRNHPGLSIAFRFDENNELFNEIV